MSTPISQNQHGYFDALQFCCHFRFGKLTDVIAIFGASISDPFS